MSLEENKAIVRRSIEVINTRDLSLLDELMASNCVVHMHEQQIQGLEASKQIIEEEIKSLDLHVTIEDMIAEGDKVWVRLREKATHKGEYRGLAPTGKELSYAVVTVWRIVERKIIEGWIV